MNLTKTVWINKALNSMSYIDDEYAKVFHDLALDLNQSPLSSF